MTNPAILRADEIRFAYGDRQVLDGVTINVERGEVFGLLGPNGSGKSTLLGILSGMLPLSGGEVRLRGHSLSPRSRRYRREVGVVFQSAALDQKLSVAENLGLTATLYGYIGGEARRRVAEALELAQLVDRAKDIAGTLSGGMKRRLDIARALLPGPSILLMDEPTTGLDEASYRALWEHLMESNHQKGTTIIMSTHRPDEAARADRLCVLHEGVAVATETPDALRAGLSNDLVVIRVVSAADASQRLAEAGIASMSVDGTLEIACEDGHALVPRIFETLEPGSVTSAEVRRPGLADAFLALTGASLSSVQEAA
jgi:ABC-2 type transport system ATP-binding protein